MTDSEIIKALEHYKGQKLFAFNGKKPEIYIHDIIDIITSQKEEIERLTETLNATIAGQETLQKYILTAKSEARREFAEKVKDLIYEADDINPVSETQIDNTLKEMESENNA